ncbi:MAG: hypothetical protein ABW178_08145 [Pseudoxanthomonas sp.]
MDTRFFMTQDSAGERRRVRILAADGSGEGAAGHSPDRYALDDGSPVHRVDNETFQVLGTGAYVTLVRD